MNTDNNGEGQDPVPPPNAAKHAWIEDILAG